MTLLGDAIDPRLPWVRRLPLLDDAWRIRAAGPQGRALRRGAEAIRHELRSAPNVPCIRTFNLTTLIYSTRLAFYGQLKLPWPYLLMLHRSLLVQINDDGKTRNVLFNPTDYTTAQHTPYFVDLVNRVPRGDAVKSLAIKRWGQLDVQLAQVGLHREDIDVIAFDHFHTQDLRPILGSTVPKSDGTSYEARFPNAILIAQRSEWEDWEDLHALQRRWYISDGKEGVPQDRVVLVDCDLALGQSCLLLRTPGHTSGNQTLFVNAEEGIFGCSENGCSVDSWTPHESRIPGLRSFVRRTGMEVVLNNNTAELAASQYNSMILERTIVDRVPGDRAFVQMLPSSEVMPSALCPGLNPSVLLRGRNHGELELRLDNH